jgi:hypothetical protein
MTNHYRSPGPVLTICALVLAASAACSSSGSKTAASSPATAPHTSSPPTTSAAASSPPASSSSAPAITQAELDAALLTRNDVGYGFTKGTYQPNPGGGPCEPIGTPSVDQRVPPAVESGTALDNRRVNAELVQEDAVYNTPAEAARAFALAVRGTSCRHGKLSDGTQVTISDGHDVSAQVNGNTVGQTTAWQLSNGTIRGVIVATLSGRVANVCIFVAGADVETSQLPNPIAVAKVAFDKLRAS